MGEQLIAQALQTALRDGCHQAVLHKDSDNAHRVEPCHAQNRMEQAGEIVASILQQRQNVPVNEGLHEQCALHLGKHRQQNAAEHDDDLRLVLIHDIPKDTLEHLAGVFDLGAGAVIASAGADFYHFRLLCHQASPPFSSKSPEPLVWLL